MCSDVYVYKLIHLIRRNETSQKKRQVEICNFCYIKTIQQLDWCVRMCVGWPNVDTDINQTCIYTEGNDVESIYDSFDQFFLFTKIEFLVFLRRFDSINL